MNTIEKQLLSLIGTGESNAVTQQEITSLLGIDDRETRLILEKARKAGTVICSSNAGRFYPESVEELQAYINRIQAAVRNECISLAPARRLLREWGGDTP